MSIFIYLSLFLDICLALYNNISFASWYSLGPQGHLFGLGRGELLRCPRQDAKDFPSLLTHLGFPGGSVRKESACNARDLGLIPGSGRSPGEGNGNPTPVFLPGEFHVQRSLADYSPWGHKEL